MRDDPTPERARALHEEEVERCRRMAAHAAELFEPGTRALTHCNAGGLATGGYGSAVGALRAAAERGLLERVLVDETRPLLQGARLTAWELERAGIPHAVIADSAAGSLMARGEVDLVVTGADRIAANGDTANKIGTYSLAVLAAHHEIPFYVVAPTSTLDRETPDGSADPDRGARPGRADEPLPGPQSRLRRDAGRADQRRSSPRTASTAPPYEESLCVKAVILAAGYATRLRPLTDDVPEASAPGRRAADARLGARPGPRGRGRRRDPPRHEQPLRPGLRGAGRSRRASPSMTTGRPRTTIGSARSATCGS